VLISQWANGLRSIPPGRCVEIELVTRGAVTRQDLRPNDWQKYWPELTKQPKKAKAAA
jgi:DNA-binding transcriptional regulator YdaS (Cro superfamily)